jgi:aminoglycoside phosphotransferase (APT) family kinase protein
MVAKGRARGVDSRTYALVAALRDRGFDEGSGDRIAVPRPLGTIPELHLWLQQKVDGVASTELLPGIEGVPLAGRIADALHKLHRARVAPRRRHTLADEIRILGERLTQVAGRRPAWGERLRRLHERCVELAGAIPESASRPIHRDFYPDHVITCGHLLYLIDLDLCCLGDPAVDVGNFVAHLTEQAIRTSGDPAALASREEALEERYLDLAGDVSRRTIRGYVHLSLARHIEISTRIEARRPFTEPLLALCEERLEIASLPCLAFPHCAG